MILEMARDFEVSSEDGEYLATAPWLSSSLRDRFVSRTKLGTDSAKISLTRSEAESLGGYLTERLASVGFDTAYELTLEGERLENLIDVFVWR